MHALSEHASLLVAAPLPVWAVAPAQQPTNDGLSEFSLLSSDLILHAETQTQELSTPFRYQGMQFQICLGPSAQGCQLLCKL